MYKMGIAQWKLSTDRIAAIERCSRLGFPQIHIDQGGTHRGGWLDDHVSMRSVKDSLGRNEVQLSAIALNCMNDVGLHSPPGAAGYDDVRTLIDRGVQTAVGLDCPLLFIPSFRQSQIRNLDDLKRSASALRWGAIRAQDKGVALATENDLSPRLLLALLELVGVDSFEILFDPWNVISSGEDPESYRQACGSSISDQVHIKWQRSGGPGEAREGACALLQTTVAATVRPDADISFVLENDYSAATDAQIIEDVGLLAQSLNTA